MTGITNQRETTVAWDRNTGQPLCRAIVWDDGRTREVVDQFTKKLDEEGFEVSPGVWKKGDDAKEALFDLCVAFISCELAANRLGRTGLRMSTYFSAIKLAWMAQHHPEVRTALDEDNLIFGTVDSWLIYVSITSWTPFTTDHVIRTSLAARRQAFISLIRPTPAAPCCLTSNRSSFTRASAPSSVFQPLHCLSSTRARRTLAPSAPVR